MKKNTLFSGTLKKMITEYAPLVNYFLSFENDFLHLNQLINKSINISFLGYRCLSCGSSEPIYRMGHCKSCFYSVPSTAEWIIRPELSKAHLGEECRDLAFEKSIQLQNHIVYLAYTGDLKVGVTRRSQIPTRWIDQGASFAIKLLEVPNRYLAGVAEVALKQYFSDKTNWRNMLKETPSEIDLVTKKREIKSLIPNHLAQYYLGETEEHITTINFPVESFPKKVKSLKLDNIEKTYSATLTGIKGQYLIFDDEYVFNIRGHEGYMVNISL